MTTAVTSTDPLEAQAALEQAVVDLLRATPPVGLGLRRAECERMYDGQPPPAAGDFFASVWYDGQRGTTSQRTNLDEIFGVYVTLTVRFTLTPDRWVKHRDFLEKRANQVKALLAKDARDYRVVRAAARLAGLRNPGSGDFGRPPGWTLGLVFMGFDALAPVGADWFSAESRDAHIGAYQRIRFGQAQRIQAVATAI
jgi:hypothetical protein